MAEIDYGRRKLEFPDTCPAAQFPARTPEGRRKFEAAWDVERGKLPEGKRCAGFDALTKKYASRDAEAAKIGQRALHEIEKLESYKRLSSDTKTYLQHSLRNEILPTYGPKRMTELCNELSAALRHPEISLLSQFGGKAEKHLFDALFETSNRGKVENVISAVRSVQSSAFFEKLSDTVASPHKAHLIASLPLRFFEETAARDRILTVLDREIGKPGSPFHLLDDKLKLARIDELLDTKNMVAAEIRVKSDPAWVTLRGAMRERLGSLDVRGLTQSETLECVNIVADAKNPAEAAARAEYLQSIVAKPGFLASRSETRIMAIRLAALPDLPQQRGTYSIRQAVASLMDSEGFRRTLPLDRERFISRVYVAAEWSKQDQSIEASLFAQAVGDPFLVTLRSLAARGSSSEIKAFLTETFSVQNPRYHPGTVGANNGFWSQNTPFARSVREQLHSESTILTSFDPPRSVPGTSYVLRFEDGHKIKISAPLKVNTDEGILPDLGELEEQISRMPALLRQSIREIRVSPWTRGSAMMDAQSVPGIVTVYPQGKDLQGRELDQLRTRELTGRGLRMTLCHEAGHLGTMKGGLFALSPAEEAEYQRAMVSDRSVVSGYAGHTDADKPYAGYSRVLEDVAEMIQLYASMNEQTDPITRQAFRATYPGRIAVLERKLAEAKAKSPYSSTSA